MEPKPEQVEGLADWTDQDIVFKDREPAIVSAENEIAKAAPLFLQDALLTVKKLTQTSRKVRNGNFSNPEENEQQLKFLKEETGHLKDVCQSYGYGLAGQVAALMYDMLDRPVRPDANVLRDFENRMMMLSSMLK